MLRLILMRHGNAEDAEVGGDDRRRRLSASGLTSSLRCGQEIQVRGFSPDLILSSHAERAKATLEAVVRGAALGGIPIKIYPDLYLASAEALLWRCSEWGDDISTLLVIGHNPGWSEAATLLSGIPLSLGTAQAALLEHYGTQWAAAVAEFGKWKLKDLVP